MGDWLLLASIGGSKEEPWSAASQPLTRPLVREKTGSERSVSQRSVARPDPGLASAGCEGVAVVAGHRLA